MCPVSLLLSRGSPFSSGTNTPPPSPSSSIFSLCPLSQPSVTLGSINLLCARTWSGGEGGAGRVPSWYFSFQWLCLEQKPWIIVLTQSLCESPLVNHYQHSFPGMAPGAWSLATSKGGSHILGRQHIRVGSGSSFQINKMPMSSTKHNINKHRKQIFLRSDAEHRLFSFRDAEMGFGPRHVSSMEGQETQPLHQSCTLHCEDSD